MLGYGKLCYDIMLCYAVMLCSTLLCHVMLCYIIPLCLVDSFVIVLLIWSIFIAL